MDTHGKALARAIDPIGGILGEVDQAQRRVGSKRVLGKRRLGDAFEPTNLLLLRQLMESRHDPLHGDLQPIIG
jgi:hypothetical protein